MSARYTRGSVGSYAKWADEANDTSYTWEKFAPYMKRPVGFTPPNVELRGDNASDIKFNIENFDPNGGPMQVAFPNYVAPFATWMKRAFEQTGTPTVVDFNDGNLNGV
jgi:choline dehydrogenase